MSENHRDHIEPLAIDPQEWGEIVKDVQDLPHVSLQYFQNIRGYTAEDSTAILTELQLRGLVHREADDDGLHMTTTPQEQLQRQQRLRRIGSAVARPLTGYVSHKTYELTQLGKTVTFSDRRSRRRAAAVSSTTEAEQDEQWRASLPASAVTIQPGSDALRRNPTIIEQRLAAGAERRIRFSERQERGDRSVNSKDIRSSERPTSDTSAGDIVDRAWKATVALTVDSPEVTEQTIHHMLMLKLNMLTEEAEVVAKEYHAKLVADGVLRAKAGASAQNTFFKRVKTPDQILDMYDLVDGHAAQSTAPNSTRHRSTTDDQPQSARQPRRPAAGTTPSNATRATGRSDRTTRPARETPRQSHERQTATSDPHEVGLLYIAGEFNKDKQQPPAMSPESLALRYVHHFSLHKAPGLANLLPNEARNEAFKKILPTAQKDFDIMQRAGLIAAEYVPIDPENPSQDRRITGYRIVASRQQVLDALQNYRHLKQRS